MLAKLANNLLAVASYLTHKRKRVVSILSSKLWQESEQVYFPKCQTIPLTHLEIETL